ncbi:hypothetical protein SPFM12_00200 [Salmonella phage SPFM12]|nr:hypothetical protein SPFM12_00200 [Salmonella phage SPFM12]
MTNYNVRVHPTNIPALGFFHQQGFQIVGRFMLKYLQQNSDRKHISWAWEPGHLVYMVVPEESRRGGREEPIKLTMFVEDDIVRGIIKIPANVYPELVEWVRDLNSIRSQIPA